MSQNRKTFILYIIGCSLIALVVVGIAIGINTYNKNKKEQQRTVVTEQLINLGIDEDEALNMDIKEASETIETITKEQFLPGYEFDKSNKEYENSDETLKSIISYASARNWNSIVSLVNGIKDKYNFTTYKNMEIISAYKDAMLLQNSKNWQQSEYENYLDNANSAICFLMMLTEAPGNNLLQFFEDETSQFPVFISDYNIETDMHYDLTNESEFNEFKKNSNYSIMKEYIENNYTSINEMKISGRINNEYHYTTCYVGNSSNFFNKVIGCYGNDDVFFTAGEWNSIKY